MQGIGFVFPGQGSQSLGMLSELAVEYAIIGDTFDQASAVLDFDLWGLVKQGPQERLNQTEITQPAVLTADIAVWRLWCDLSNIRPSLIAGHSLGEYAALVAAESLTLEEAVALVAMRGKCMQHAVAPGAGAMAAIIGADGERVKQLCEQCAQDQVLQPANYNSPGQVVIAGHVQAVERAVSQAREIGAKMAKVIPVSVPAHCPLMQPAAAQFAEHLDNVELSSPTMTIIHNVDLSSHDSQAKLKETLLQQLVSPVLWVDTVQEFVKRGISAVIECGPAKVLQGLNKRIAPQLTTYTINTPGLLEQARAALMEYEA